MNINEMLEDTDILVRVGSEWFLLNQVGPISDDDFPVIVSNDDGEEFEFDMADIDEIDTPIEMDSGVFGVA
tara:strand:- start:574 stop:786 length:213 start_codon:yes stop_codon:yes gene_type:complete